MFLAQYNITLLSISAQKSITGMADQNICLAKAALRRTQLIDPSNWIVNVPLIVQGLNEQLLYGKVSRNVMYFNPSYYRTTLNLLSLDNHPSSLFEEQIKSVEWICEKRKARLKRAATRCKEVFHVRNLCTDYGLVSSSNESSQEIAPLIKRSIE